MSTVDFSALLYGPSYEILSVTGTILTAGAKSASIAVIDKTIGIEILDSTSGLKTILPAAILRRADLDAASITRAELRRAKLTMNGKDWRIENTMPKPSPNGEADGEVLLILVEW